MNQRGRIEINISVDGKHRRLLRGEVLYDIQRTGDRKDLAQMLFALGAVLQGTVGDDEIVAYSIDVLLYQKEVRQ